MASCPRNLSFKQFIILIISYYIFVVHSAIVQQIGQTKIGLTTQERENQVKKKKGKVLPSDNNSPSRTDYPRETESGKKKGKVLPSDTNNPNRIEYLRETEPGEKKRKVLPSDTNSPNRIEYPRETESGEKKGKVHRVQMQIFIERLCGEA